MGSTLDCLSAEGEGRGEIGVELYGRSIGNCAEGKQFEENDINWKALSVR